MRITVGLPAPVNAVALRTGPSLGTALVIICTPCVNQLK
jgi:hypothetical protein